MYTPFVWIGADRYQSKSTYKTYSEAVEWVKRMCHIYGVRDAFGGAKRFQPAVLPSSVAA